MRRSRFFALVALALALAGCGQPAVEPTPGLLGETGADAYARFEADLEALRLQHKIPGLSAAIVQGHELRWTRGFGYAGLENELVATPDTAYYLASLTKPFAAILIMQLVEEGALDLEDPVAQYGVDLDSTGVIRVKHLLSMTSEGNPGEAYSYNGGRYMHLGQVIEAASGKSFEELVFERILEPLEMASTAPAPAGCAGLAFSSACDLLYDRLATPYQLDPRRDIAAAYYWHDYLGAAGGLISTVVDLAKLDVALDQNALVSQEAKERMFAPTVSTSGGELPYGLGWFTQDYQETRLVWHYGYWPPSVSSLILKAPKEKLTLIVLANTDNLSRPYRLGDGDVLRSPLALAFYERFVYEPRTGQSVPDIDWAAVARPESRLKQYDSQALRDLLEKEVESYQMLAASRQGLEELGQRIEAKLAKVDLQVYDAYLGQWQAPADLGGGIYAIDRDGDRVTMENPQGARLELYPQSPASLFHMSSHGMPDFQVTFIRDETGQPVKAVVVIGGQEFTFQRIGESGLPQDLQVEFEQ